MAEPVTPGETTQSTPGPGRRRLRRALIVLGSLVVLVLILVALAPTIAGAVAPGYARDAINQQINGKAEVGRVSLSWFGGQRVGPITITDAAGQPVAEVNLALSRGLLSLARSALGSAKDLGQATVSGSATIVRRPDGTTNLQDLLKKPSAAVPPRTTPAGRPAPGAPPKVPQITGSFVIEKFDARFIDQGRAGSPAAAVRLPALSGSVSVVNSTTADATLKGDLLYGPDADRAATPGGSISLTAHADSLTDGAGTLTADRAAIDLKADAKDIATVIADALAGMDQRLVAAIGEKMQASIRAAGTMAKGDASITASAPAFNADLAFAAADGVLTAPRPGRISVQTAGLPSLSPALEQSLRSGQTATFDRLPQVTAVLDQLRVPLPTGGKPLDLRTAAVGLTVETTETTGTVRLASTDGRSTQGQPFTIAPLKARLASDDLAKGATLTANTQATISGQSAGTLAVNLSAGGLLDSTGRPRPGVPTRLTGSADLTGVATAIAQPFAEPMGLDLSRDVGPQLDLALRASATGEGDGAPASAENPSPGPAAAALPATHLALDVKSTNLNSAARLVYDQTSLRTERGGVQVRIAEVGPLASRMLKAAGVSIENAGPVALVVSDLAVDLARLNPPGAKRPDLRAISAAAKLDTGRINGRLAVANQPARTFQVAPMSATIDAADLSKGAALKASTSARLDGSPAGTLDADLRATGIVNADGSPATRLPALQGRLALSGISTTIAQPMVESAGLDLPAGIGPTLDLVLVAAPTSGSTSTVAGPVPTTALDLTIDSTNLKGAVALLIEGRTIRRRDRMEITLASPGLLAGRAANSSGMTIAPGGSVTLAARDLAIAFDEAWKPRLDQSTADAGVAAAGLSIAPIAASGEPPPPVSLEQLAINTHLAPGKPPGVDLRASGAHQGAAFSAQGALELYGLFTAGPGGAVALTPANVRPTGTIDLTNLPTSLVALGAPAPKPGGMDLQRLVREAIGPSVNVRLAATRPPESRPGARAVALDLKSQRFNGGLAAGMDDRALSLTKLDFRGQVTPELAAALIDMAGGGAGLASRPNLVSPATLTIAATPFSVPLKGDEPDFSGAPDASIKVGLEGKALVNNVVLKSETGPPRDLGTVGVENLLLTAIVPLSSLAPGSQPKPATVAVTGGVLGGNEARVVDLKGNGRVLIADRKPTGDLNADFSLGLLDAAWLDTFLGQPGMVTGAIGQSASLDATALVQFPAAASAPGEKPAPAFSRATLTAAIKSPRLATTQSLKATALPDHLSIDSPMILKWTVDPAWANAYVMGGRSLKQGQTLAARFDSPLDLTVSLSKLTLALGSGTGPLKQGVFLLDTQVTSPGANLQVGEGKAAPAKLTSLLARVHTASVPNTLGFDLTIDDAGGGRAPGGKPAIDVTGNLAGISDAAGNPTFGDARLSMNGNATGVPTGLVDALARQDGLLVEALGPTATLAIKTRDASDEGGRVSADFTSQRAEAHLRGNIQNGQFIASGPADVVLKEITPDLGSRFIKGLPSVGLLEKRPEDGPATIKATGFTAPLDGDLRKLNGQVVIDLGQARFATGGLFASILKVTGQKGAGEVGRRLEPINVAIKQGVASYDKITIPLGEFTFASRGTVDLVNKQMDVITYIPVGALTDEAAGILNTGAGSVFSRLPAIGPATMIPFRTTGPFHGAEPKLDMQLFLQESGQSLRPDKALDNLFKDLFKKK
jgi:hypothetical protein